MIRFTNVSFSYENNIINQPGFHLHIDHLEIQPREHIACIGPSGSGKTTLVNLIAGIILPDSGTIEFRTSNTMTPKTVARASRPQDSNGRDARSTVVISNQPDAVRRANRISQIGMVFQEFELLEYLTALDNILLPYFIAGSTNNQRLELTSEVRKRASHLAREMRIDHVLSRRPNRLSHGERQRLAICRALSTEPELLMCDEPTGNLDPETAAITLDLLFDQVRQRNATLLMVTHDHSLLDRFDHILDMCEINSDHNPTAKNSAPSMSQNRGGS